MACTACAKRDTSLNSKVERRLMQEMQQVQVNFLRQYYDVYQLLQLKEVQQFLGSEEYKTHKQNRFPNADLEIPLKDNQALLLEDEKVSN